MQQNFSLVGCWLLSGIKSFLATTTKTARSLSSTVTKIAASYCFLGTKKDVTTTLAETILPMIPR
jgi:hypothetical protein